MGEVLPSLYHGPGAGDWSPSPSAPVDLYGVADAACALYTLGMLDPTTRERDEWAQSLGSFQDPDTGLFHERGPDSHVELHRTAYAVAAMELLGLRPPHRIRQVESLADTAELESFLDARDWRHWVYLESHAGAAVGSLFALLADLGADSEWWDVYFDLLDSRLDPANGMHGLGKAPQGDLDQIGGTFHYAFVHEQMARPLRYDEARVDAVLGLQRPDGLWDHGNPLWLTLDAVYLLNRDTGRNGHRRDEAEAAVRRAVLAVLDALGHGPNWDSWLVRHDLASHNLVALLSLLAEAQRCLGPDVIVAEPLHLVLDRRPFI